MQAAAIIKADPTQFDQTRMTYWNNMVFLSYIGTDGGRHRLPDQIYTLRRPGVPTRALLLTSLGTAGRLQAVINSAH